MFGLKHCIHYHCDMNGTNGPFEQEVPNMNLCPVCVMKLHLNIKFNVAERYQKMIEACNSLGFDSKAKLFQSFLDEAEVYKAASRNFL